MKRLLFSAFILTLGLVACQNKDSGSSSPAPTATPTTGTYATTPQPCNAQQITPNCYNTNNQVMPGQWPYGSWYWPNQWQPSSGYCGCPSGYAPVYSQSMGMACAPYDYFASSSVVYFNWGFNFGPAQNGQWLNVPQNQYNPAVTGQCYNQTAQGCDVRTNNCPSGSVCQPITGGSTIGLCVRGP